MVDTIVITLSPDTYHISNPDLFTPSAFWALEHDQRGPRISKQNPIKKGLLHGIYKPRLTLARQSNIA